MVLLLLPGRLVLVCRDRESLPVGLGRLLLRLRCRSPSRWPPLRWHSARALPLIVRAPACHRPGVRAAVKTLWP